MATDTTSPQPHLHSYRISRRIYLNRVFAVVYTLAIISLIYHHFQTLFLPSNTFISISITLTLLTADLILSLMWLFTQSFRMNPISRQVFPEKLEKVLERSKFPDLDIFICTADPYKEPPLNVVNTALSVMGYDYPPEKISVYVSDDGGSQLTLFAFMEAAKFAKHWLPFCTRNHVIQRCPDSYFKSNYSLTTQTQDIKIMYEDMKLKIENAVEKGNVPMDYITSELDRQVFCKWKDRFSPQDHPSIIQVLLDGENDKDVVGDSMPNLIYVSREKRKTSPHHFKAGALNALLRVSAIMTNAPLVLTLDCDMFSNDPITVHRVLCFLMGHPSRPNLGFIQFPQKYHGLNKADIYSSEHKRLFIVNPMGMDGLKGPPYVGTGCFFNRRVFFGSPSKYVQPDTPELSPDFVSNKPISSNSVLDLAHDVAACNYEDLSNWGSQIGFRYGSLVEDYYTGYRLQCEGWQSIFCNPDRPAFLGDIPITLIDILSQNKRWCIGLLEVGFSNFSPIKYGLWALGPLVANSWAHYAFWPFWFIPITVYAYLPQLALLNELHIFPKLCDPWFFLYAFLFVGAYGQDCLDFILAEGTFKRWWSDQRMWIIRGLSSHTFGIMEYIMKQLGIETQGFNVTSKVIDDEQNVNYEQGLFEFGVTSHLFIPLSVAAMLNFIAFFMGFLQIVVGRGKFDQVFVQMFIAGFGIMNSLPFYDAMFLRADKGKMHIKTIIHSALVVGGVYIASKILFGIGYK